MAVVDKNKLLGKVERGGDLMVRPTTSLVGSSGGKITKTSDEKDVVYTISTKLVKVDKFLKGNLEAEKVQQKKEQKQKENELRAEQEADKEKPDDKKQEKESPKSLIPKMSFLDGIKKFLGDVLVGWLTFRLIKFLPKIVKLLKPIAAFADFVIDVGGKLLDGLVSFIDWGYKAVEGTRGWIEEKFGEGAAEKFDSFTTNLNSVMNIVIALGLAAAKFRKPKGPKPPKGPKGRLRKAAERWFKKTRIGKTVRNAQAIRKKLTRNITRNIKQRAGKVTQALNPKNWKMPQVKTPGWMKKAGAAIQKRIAGADAWIKSIPARTRQMWDDVAKRVGPYIDEMGQGIANAGKSIGAKWTEVTENMKPQKVIDDLMAKVRPAIDDILKKNPIIGKLLNNLKPKNARKAIQGLLNKAASNPALKKLIKTLKANKGASKGLGPVDKIITALMALADYAAFKESPINAILKGLGGLLGYGVGFSAASAVPVLGQSGIFNFAGGMAGGIAGEWLAMKMAKFLAGTKLGKIEDPIMNDGRMLVRDPDGLMDHMLKGVGGEEPIVKDNVEGGKTTNEGGKTTKKISKEFKMGKKTYDLSKLQGGLSNEDYLALSNVERSRLDRRMAIWRNQNKEEWHANVKGNANNIVSTNGISNKVNNISTSDEEEETIVIKRGSETEGGIAPETQTKESITPVVAGGGGGSREIDELLYKGG